MNETPETPVDVQLSEQDIEDLRRLGVEAPSYHTILQVWREVLSHAPAEMKKPVTPHWANRMVQAYPELRYADMNEFRDRFFGKIVELEAILAYEISTDENCLSYTTPEEDVAENGHHYKNLLLTWQQAVLTWELEWDCTDPAAAVELGAISEVHKMFFGPTGLTQYLDNIKLEFTEADQQDLAAALEAMREKAVTGE